MVVNHKIQFFLIFVEVYFYRAIFPIILVAFINRNFPLLDALHRSHFQCGKCEGRRSQSSEARTPSLALPPRWARKGVLHLWCVTRLTFVCMLRYSEWDAVPIWVPGFFGTYSGMVYWAGFRTLQYLQWNVILIWFPNSSIFIMSRYSNPSSGLFGICAETLRRYSYTPTIPGQDAPRPLPSPARVLSFFLSAGSVSQRERISVRAVAEEGWYNLGPGRGRYCGRVGCLSQRRVLALPQWF